MNIPRLTHLTSMFRSASRRCPKLRRRAFRIETIQVLESRQLLSAVVELVQDLNAEPGSGLAFARPDGEFFPIGDTLYFVGQTTLHGQELWKSDGTESGTLRLTDINPGPWGTSIEHFENVNGVLYFAATGSISGTAVWRSDGTVGGTERVLQLSPEFTDIRDITNVNGTLFFVQSNQLWKTNGRSENAAIVPTPPGRIRELKASAERLFFSFEDAFTGETSIWTSDGTAPGTMSLNSSLVDVDLTEQSSIAVGGLLYFAGEEPGTGNELWVSDGTVSGTHILKDIQPGRNDSLFAQGSMIEMGGILYFEASDGSTGTEVWRSDGTLDGTTLLKDTEPGRASANLSGLISTEGKLYFRTNDTIWSSDGTTSGTAPIPGLPDNTAWDLVGLGGNVYFGVLNSSQAIDLWTSDGTAQGTVRLTEFEFTLDVFADYKTLVSTDSRVFFGAVDRAHGKELWSTDGSVAGTSIVTDIRPGTASSQFFRFANAGDSLFFTTPRTDTQYPNTQFRRLQNGIVTSVNSVAFPQLEASASLGDELYFPAFDYLHGMEIWKWTGAAPELLKDVNPGPQSGAVLSSQIPSGITSLNGKLYFLAEGPETGLWTSNGTSEGTSLIWNHPEASSAGPFCSGLFRVDNTIYFLASFDNVEFELWQSDGTVEGTRLVQIDTDPPKGGVNANGLTYLQNRHLTVTDGTAANTFDMLVGINSEVRNVGPLTSFNGSVYFAATTGNDQTELWRSSGTPETTAPFVDVWPGFESSHPEHITVLAGKLLFVATDPVHGNSIWQSDGTPEGTRVLKSFGSGARIASWTLIDNRVFFTAPDSSSGLDAIWVTDGSATGTFQMAHSLETQLSLHPFTVFAPYSDGIAFIAGTEAVDFELFRIDTTLTVTPPRILSVDNDVQLVTVLWPDVRGAVQYDVWIDNLSNPALPPVKNRVNEPRYLVGEDLADGAYRIWVRSYPVQGEPSPWSSPADFVVGNDPVMHAILSQSLEDQPMFRWSGPEDVVSYELWLTNRDTKTRTLYRSGLTATSLNVDQPMEPARYAVWVRGTRADRSTTNWSSLTEFDVMAPAIVLTEGIGDFRISRPTFMWDAVAGATGYDIWIQTVGTSTLVFRADNVQGLSHQTTREFPAGEFKVFVRALRGTRPLSVWGSGQLLRILLAPSGLRKTENGFAWNSVPTASSYTIELRNAQGALALPITTTVAKSFTPTSPLSPGKYTLRVSANFVNASSNWSPVLAFEVLHSPVSITSSNVPTADATPIITWSAAPGSASYEVFVARVGSSAAVYSRREIIGTSHRINTALPAGFNQIWVRAHFADGSRSAWSAVQQLEIRPAPVVTFANGQLKWNSVTAATHYELYVNFLGSPTQQRIVHEKFYVGTSYTIPSTLPKGRYHAWVRAIRAESGELYNGLWSSVLAFAVT